LQWLEGQKVLEGSVVTGIPDYSEVAMPIEKWKEWFIRACCLIFSKLHEDECAIMIQTDVKDAEDGFEWIDKSYLCNKACEITPGIKLVWHKIVSFNTDINNKVIKHVYHGKRAGYSHLMCYRKDASKHIETLPDIILRGDQIWEKGSGFNACMVAIQYVKEHTSKSRRKCIIDPFCGKGSVLAVANHLGVDAMGVEIKPSLSRNAMNLSVDADRSNGNHFLWKRKTKDNNHEESEEQETWEDGVSDLF